MSSLKQFAKLLLSDPGLTFKLLHPRRVKNALRFLAFNSGNLAQLYRRYQDIYIRSDSAIHERIVDQIENCPAKLDVFVFPVIDWHFRFQRPQHLISQLGLRGFRVFYFSTMPMLQERNSRYQLTDNPAENVFLCKLYAESGMNDDLHRHPMSSSSRDDYHASIQELMRDLRITNPAIIVQHHYWAPLATTLPHRIMGYDCMDHHAAFHDPNCVHASDQETQLIWSSDFVVASSLYLKHRIESIKPCALVRNGCDFSIFSALPIKSVDRSRPVVGYVGAIAEWFDMPLLIQTAKLLPDWQFLLVGAHVGCDVGEAKQLSNIELFGEVEYAEIGGYISRFDICIIPFRLTELTKATNPVKVYEYLSAGKPVVSTPLPEVVAIGDIVLTADTPELFAQQLRKAIELAGKAAYVENARAWASGHDWAERAGQFEKLLLDET